MSRTISIIRNAYPEQPGLDTAVSRALLMRASAGEVGETFRLHVPGRIVAFGKQDVVSPGFAEAVAASSACEYLPIVRLAGGRAAVFNEHTLAFSWTIPTAHPPADIHHRFRQLADLMVATFGDFGLDARVGEVPGEYCPGEYSVNLGGEIKVMGVGQRLTRHAAHVGGVVVVRDSAVLRAILEPVYAALGLPWRPETAGALTDQAPGVHTGDVITAVLHHLGRLADLTDGTIDASTLELARSLAPDHLPAAA